jgi:hypothetical protein
MQETHIRKMRNAHKILIWKHKGNSLLGDLRVNWKFVLKLMLHSEK